MALVVAGDIEAADSEIEAYARTAEDLRQPYHLSFVTALRAMRAMMSGRFEECEKLVVESLEIARLLNVRDARAIAAVQLLLLRREQGRLAELVDTYDATAKHYRTNAAWPAVRAFLHATIGSESEARRELEALLPDDSSDKVFGSVRDAVIVWLSQVSAILGDKRRAAWLYELLLPLQSGSATVAGPMHWVESPSHDLGLLASTLGRYDDAERHFEDAIAKSGKLGAPPWVARTRYHYAEMLLRRGDADDREKTIDLVTKALKTAEELGMKKLVEDARALMSPILASAKQAKAEAQHVGGESAPNNGTVFRREGDYWTIAYEGKAFRLRHTRGLRYLAELLRNPGQQIYALDLVAVGQERGARSRDGADLGDAGKMIDAQAKGEYRRRIEEFEEELEEAERFNDTGRSSNAREEIEFLRDELARAIGLGGRDRKAASAAERARLNVTMGIKATLKKISENNAALGHHLEATIKTGKFSSYTPDPRAAISWDF